MNEEKPLRFMIAAVVLIFSLAASVLVGGAILDNWEKSVRDTTTVTKTGLVLLNNTEVATGYGYLQTINSCYNETNSSDLIPAAKLSATEGTRTESYITLDATGGGAKFDNTTVNCSIDYLASNSQSSAAVTFETGLFIFATFISVIALAIIGKLILMLYRRNN